MLYRPPVRVLVVGAAGMLGRKLVERLLCDGAVAGEPVSQVSLVDVVEPAPPGRLSVPVETAVADIAEHRVAAELVSARPDVVFHLAAVLSGEAEAEFEKGYRTNLDGTRILLEAVRRAGGGTARASSSPRRSPYSEHRSRTRSATTSTPRR